MMPRTHETDLPAQNTAAEQAAAPTCSGGNSPDCVRSPERFADSAYLRSMLVRLHESGTWRTDEEANEFMAYVIDRFAGLARRHGLEPDDGGVAAWDAIHRPSILMADDPWGSIVKAVRCQFAAGQFAQEALCSLERAKRQGLSGVCPVRFGEREDTEWEEVLTAPAPADVPDLGWSVNDVGEHVAGFFAEVGWPLAAATTAIDVVFQRLSRAGDRRRAYERLRKDRRWPGLLGLPRESWTSLLRILLGAPTDPDGYTPAGQGVLLRLALGESLEDLAEDFELICDLTAACPPDPSQPAKVVPLIPPSTMASGSGLVVSSGVAA